MALGLGALGGVHLAEAKVGPGVGVYRALSLEVRYTKVRMASSIPAP